MRHLPNTQIRKLREYGYGLNGENWLKISRHDYAEECFSIVKIVNGDTLATIYIPADIMAATEFDIC
ncbi:MULTISPECIES: hypothetical protein [Geotalea]|uniref:hypothetical protein n=1 Tax=Geotalea TaxID=2910589 RepID=UPI000191DEDC|nr:MULTISPECIES: hypothetical protein [Geotalea]